MKITEFAFNLLLIFFPGIICAYMVDMFTIHRDRTQFQFVINAFLLGFASYLIYAIIIYYCSPKTFDSIYFLNVLTSGNFKISIKEILAACIVSVVLSVIIIVINTHKIHFRLFQTLKITRKFGEQDVWGFLMNSSTIEWVTVRDLENNILYDGSIKAFSDNSKDAELLLENVNVYKNDTGEYLYKVSAQYLSLNRDNISIEVRSPNKGENT